MLLNRLTLLCFNPQGTIKDTINKNRKLYCNDDKVTYGYQDIGENILQIPCSQIYLHNLREMPYRIKMVLCNAVSNRGPY